MISLHTNKRPALIAWVVLVLLGAFTVGLVHIATADHAGDFHASHQCQICAWYQIGVCLIAGVTYLFYLLVQRLNLLRWLPPKHTRYTPTLGRAPPIR